jgi:CDP-diacylglycerol--glycerol-3-phosphate 3-phosphatidyltransferase
MKLKMSWTIPNILTTIRLLAIPFMAWFIYAMGKFESQEKLYSMIAFGFFVGIWMTDAVDGFIARHFNQISDFGKIYDPFVDKIFQFTTALFMLFIDRIPLWVVVFIFSKEVVMVLGGAYLLQSRQLVVHSKWYGKASTVLFVLAFASVFFVSSDQSHLTKYIFIAPVLMSTYATVRYGITMIKDSTKLSDPKPDQTETSDKSVV